jgi:lauroyl/myristoyl acyltransferase
MRRADQKRVAEQMCRTLEIPRSESEALAVRWMNNLIRRACYDLTMLSEKAPVCRGDITGLEHLDRAQSAGRGVLLVCIHGFAAIAAKRLLRQMGYSILSVRRISTPKSRGRLARHYLEPRLHRLGARMLAHAEAVSADDPVCALKIAQHLRDGAIVEMAADARTSRTSVVVPFLKGSWPISSGVLDVARLCRCPVLPLVASYSDDGLRLQIGEPFQSLDFPVLIKELERQVRAYPDQWEKWLEPLEA